jgi:ATP synthase protein I
MKQEWRPWTLVTQLGLTVVLTLLAMLFLGIWLDGLFGTRPWLTLLFALVGIIVATVTSYRMVAKVIREIPSLPRGTANKYDDEEDEDDENDEGDGGEPGRGRSLKKSDSESGSGAAPREPANPDNSEEDAR